MLRKGSASAPVAPGWTPGHSALTLEGSKLQLFLGGSRSKSWCAPDASASKVLNLDALSVGADADPTSQRARSQLVPLRHADPFRYFVPTSSEVTSAAWVKLPFPAKLLPNTTCTFLTVTYWTLGPRPRLLGLRICKLHLHPPLPLPLPPRSLWKHIAALRACVRELPHVRFLVHELGNLY